VGVSESDPEGLPEGEGEGVGVADALSPFDAEGVLLSGAPLEVEVPPEQPAKQVSSIERTMNDAKSFFMEYSFVFVYRNGRRKNAYEFLITISIPQDIRLFVSFF
jgi:hypothetical protein